jgi:hypothetical protein
MRVPYTQPLRTGQSKLAGRPISTLPGHAIPQALATNFPGAQAGPKAIHYVR